MSTFLLKCQNWHFAVQYVQIIEYYWKERIQGQLFIAMRYSSSSGVAG